MLILFYFPFFHFFSSKFIANTINGFRIQIEFKLFETGPIGTRFFGVIVYKFTKRKYVNRADFLTSSEILSYITNVVYMI